MTALKFPRKFNTVSRGQLYHQKYRYGIKLCIRHACTLRELTPAMVKQSIQNHNFWRSRLQGEILPGRERVLLAICDYLNNRTNPYKRVVSSSYMWVYTNHPDDFADAESLIGVQIFDCTEAEVYARSDAVVLKTANHQFRTYFTERWLKDHERDTLREYFKTRRDQFRLGPGFSRFVSGSRSYMMSNYFVDHNEVHADLLINMAVPGVVRKTLPIVARD